MMFGYLLVTIIYMVDEAICVCQEFFKFKILIPCLTILSSALFGASTMFIASVLFREYIDCHHQLVALVQ